jgi:hypothetical protein
MKEYIVLNRACRAEAIGTKSYCLRYMLRSGKRAELTTIPL